jgi:hypothetical protein
MPTPPAPRRTSPTEPPALPDLTLALRRPARRIHVRNEPSRVGVLECEVPREGMRYRLHLAAHVAGYHAPVLPEPIAERPLEPRSGNSRSIQTQSCKANSRAVSASPDVIMELASHAGRGSGQTRPRSRDSPGCGALSGFALT